jgi:lipopolysaccharide transport system ATP-binding protein
VADAATGMAIDQDVLIKAEHVSKKFCRSLKRSLWYGVRDMAREVVGGGNCHDVLRQDEFWAIDDVSFEVRRGECLGLIGHNGAGKTTLLRMLNGLIKPDHGSITIRGHVGALIALGAGFNPILTGRENIYVNGGVLGLTKREVDQKIDDIVEFAEIAEFIDSPVHNYSSGMQVRLGFAVATSIEPDVLILDEVLAVGDAAFRAKCFKRIGDLARQSAILFVSHDQSQVVRICDKALLLDHGKPKYCGLPREALTQYRDLRVASAGRQICELDAAIAAWSLQPFKGEAPEGYRSGTPLRLSMTFHSRRRVTTGVCLINFFDESGTPAAQVDLSDKLREIPEGKSSLEVSLLRLDLAEGNYSINVAIFGAAKTQTIVHAVGCGILRVLGAPFLWTAYKAPVTDLVWLPCATVEQR